MRRWIPLVVVHWLVLATAAAGQADVIFVAGADMEPETVGVTAGGKLLAAASDECDYGYVSSVDEAVVLTYAGLDETLYIYAEGEGDTMILVMKPDSTFVCDDDSHGNLNPLVSIPRAEIGVYVILVGAYSQNETLTATLYIGDRSPDSDAVASTGDQPSISLNPTYGSVTLSAGFTPDPHTRSLSAGGGVEVALPGCSYGYVARAPDYNLTYDGSGDLYFFVRADEDTTLLINRPDGSWICDDDSFGDSNPVIAIRGASSGLYNVWVGTYSDDGLVSATLHISGKAAK